MSDSIDSYIESLPAVVNYHKVIQENNTLSEEIKSLKLERENYTSALRLNYEADVKNAALDMLRRAFEERMKPVEQRSYDKALADSGLPGIIDAAIKEDQRNSHGNRIRKNYFRKVSLCADEMLNKSNLRGKAKRDLELRLKTKRKVDPFVALAGGYEIYCKLCKSSHNHTLILSNPGSIELVLTMQSVEILGSGVRASHPHNTRVSLTDLIESYLGRKGSKIRRIT